MQTNKEHQFQDTEYYVSRQAQESSFLKFKDEIRFGGKGRRGSIGRAGWGRGKEKGERIRTISCENCEAVSQGLPKYLSQDEFCCMSAYTTSQVPLQR